MPADGHDRDVERVHRQLRRLGPGRVRPLRLRRPAGRGRRQLRHRPVHGRRRAHRRRHQARRRRRRRPRPRASRTGFGAWTVLGAPDGSPAQRRATSRRRRPRRHVAAVTATADTLLLRLRPRAARFGCRSCRRGGADARPLRGVVARRESGDVADLGLCDIPRRTTPVRSTRPETRPLDLIAPSVRRPPAPTCEAVPRVKSRFERP